MLDLAVIIVSWNVRDHLSECLASTYAELNRSRLHGAVWVVDNGSTDGTLALLDNIFPHTHVISNQHNAGFGAANNQGMDAAADYQPRYLFLLNPDTLVRAGSLAKLVQFLDQTPDAGMAGARLVYRNGRFQHSAFAFPGILQLCFDLWPFSDRLYESRLNGRYPRQLYDPSGPPFVVDHLLGAAMMIRRDVAEKTGGFDESFHMYCEEIDWSWRIHNAGWSIYTVPAAEIVHYGGESTKQVPTRSIVELWHSRAQLYQKHHDRLTLALARRIARKGLRRKAARAADPRIRAAYQRAAEKWEPDAMRQPQSEIAAG